MQPYNLLTEIYSREIPNSSTPGTSNIFIHPEAKHGLFHDFLVDSKTLYETFKSVVAKFPMSPYLGTRSKKPDGTVGDYEWLSYAEVNRKAKKIGWGLAEFGFCEKDSDGNSFFGIYSKNRAEWIICDLACIFHNIITVPIYDTLQPDAWII
jgi:long-chain acyl-CoA synthetase